MTDDNKEEPLTENSLQAKLISYQKAMQEEYAVAQKTSEANEANKEAVVEEFFDKHVPVAAAKIVHLMQFGSSDSTQLSAAKYILDRKPGAGSTDPIQALIKELQSKPAVRMPSSK